MAQIVKELRVDVSQPNVFQAIVAKQHDSNSRFLKITLVDFGVKVEVPNTAKVTINANRPDGASESFKGEANNDGTITVPLAQWMLDIDGEVKCDVSVTSTEDNKRLTSTDFWLEVQKAANPNASIPLDPDGEILIIKPVTEINGNSKDTDYPSAKAVYDYGQNIVTDTQITATATGSAITIESAKAPLQNLKLFGKTEQDGIPTPTEPKELKSVGDSGSFEVGVYGRNLLDVPQEYACSGSGYVFSKLPIRLHKGNYILSLEYSGNGVGLVQFDVWNKDVTETRFEKQLRNISAGKYTIPFTIDIEENQNLYLYHTFTVGTIKKCQLELGTEATPYEPCNKQSLTLTDTLRGIGDIADEKDFARGVKTERFGIVDLGTLNWRMNATNRFLADNLSPQTKPFSVEIKGNGLCDIYPIGTWNQVNRQEKDRVIAIYENQVYISDTSFTDLATFKSAMSGKYLLYELAEPIETPISETELNAYRHLMTNKGTTTFLNSDGADMQVDYYINKPNAQSIGNIHTQINKDYFKLQQAIILTGGN